MQGTSDPPGLARSCLGACSLYLFIQARASWLVLLACLFSLTLVSCRLPAPVKTFPPPSDSSLTTHLTITPTPGLADTSSLPHALYFLHQDEAGIPQVWRLDKDGKTLKPLTSATAPVRDYDIASDGRLAYVAAGILAVELPGLSQPEVWYNVPADQPAGFPHAPRWSPDGKTLAFAAGGIRLIQAGQTLLVYSDPADGSQRTFPYVWSPDGRWLLANQDQSQGSTLVLLEVATGEAHPLANTPLCCQAVWSPDSQGLFIANPFMQQGPSGLWWASLSNQMVPLMLATAPDGTYNVAGWPHVASDGTLSYAFANFPSQPPAVHPLGLYNASLSDPTQRQALRLESFFLREVLWAADGRRAVLALPAPGTNSEQLNGPLLLVTTGQQPAQPLIESGYNLKWGP